VFPPPTWSWNYYQQPHPFPRSVSTNSSSHLTQALQHCTLSFSLSFQGPFSGIRPLTLFHPHHMLLASHPLFSTLSFLGTDLLASRFSSYVDLSHHSSRQDPCICNYPRSFLMSMLFRGSTTLDVEILFQLLNLRLKVLL
jgi:hypothetical protein